MRAELLLETLRERRRALVWWGVGVAAMVALNVAFYPSVKDATGLNDYARDLPDAMRALFVGGESDLVSPTGYLNSQVFALMAPLLLLIFAIGAGAAAIAGEEERGTLDLLLAQPVTRGRVVRERFAALALSVAAVSAVVGATVLATAPLVGLEIGFGVLVAASVSIALLALLYGAIALAAGSVWPGRARAIAIATGLAVAAWMLDGFGRAVSFLEPWRWASPYYQAIGKDPLRDGAPWGGWAMIAGLTAAVVVVAAIGLARRDVRQ